jgi:predicted lipoprotein with Yx(FWY)xxD motif
MKSKQLLLVAVLGATSGAAAVWAADLAHDVPPPGIRIQPSPVPTNLGDTSGIRLQGYDPEEVYADARGLTLYRSDRDTSGKSACLDTCLKTWRPVLAAALDQPRGDWAIVVRTDDRTRQWAFKGQPVYTFAGDFTPGDTAGDNSGQVWHAVVRRAPFRPAEITLQVVDGRPVLADTTGRTLYTFDGDEDLGNDFSYDEALPGKDGARAKIIGHCIAGCAETWHALLAPPDAKVPPGGDWSLVPREDDPSKKQWAYRKYPLYSYVGDTKPGEAKGANIKYGPPGAQNSVMFRIASTETGRL